MNIDSIIFDLDGTLWDSTKALSKAWSAVSENCEEVKRPITEAELGSVMGLQMHEIAAKLFPNLDGAAQAKILNLCCIEEKKLLLKDEY